MKKALKVLVIIAVAIYFMGNVLPNLIGVPLAAYHSYVLWNETQKSPSEIKSAYDQNTKFPKSIGIVNDFSQIFTADQRNALSEKLYDYEVETTRQIVIVTVDSIKPYDDIQKYATDLANDWGVGNDEKDNGLLLVLCKSCNQFGIATGYGTELVLTDEICKKVIDSTIIPQFKNEKFHKGIDKGVTELIEKWK